MRTFLRLIVVAAVSFTGLSAQAAPECPKTLPTSSAPAAPAADQAVAQAKSFNDALIDAAKNPKEREKKLGTAIDSVFNIQLMTQVVVGSTTWPKLSAADRSAVQAAMRNYMIVRFATEFDTYNNQKFNICPGAQVSGANALVRTIVLTPNETPDELNYRLKKSGETWRVVDLYYNGVSDLSLQRTNLSATAAKGSAAALVAKIDELTKKLR